MVTFTSKGRGKTYIQTAYWLMEMEINLEILLVQFGRESSRRKDDTYWQPQIPPAKNNTTEKSLKDKKYSHG